MSNVIPFLPAHLTGEAVREYFARTDEFSRRRLARWEAQMDAEFPKLDCPDLGFIPLGRPPERSPPGK